MKKLLTFSMITFGISLTACTSEDLGLATQVLNNVSTIPSRPNGSAHVIATSNANGRYSDLLQVINCPEDMANKNSYGDYYDWGYWESPRKRYCGQKVQAGYWVWLAPNWYIWKNSNVSTVKNIYTKP